ncbi:NAAT family transporter [Marinifilum sp. N1E240]|uniref:MarC family protein n=1 Tax=Marinifilum sp. N1E240 TaxID=2608082 RepID=UPI00128B73AF|nr:MarC family protein [Marinifilum sp. N1E240]MPQ47132.1 NAAT family transporter [Marinifilum sp. N1E240]
MDLLNFTITTFTAFFAIVNPIANAPIFIGLTKDRSSEEKKKASKTSTLVAFFIGFAFILFGNYIFKFFHLTIPGFKIAGGILLFYVGFEMLQSKKSNIHNAKENEGKENISISPLAIPILAGPGTLVTAMNAASHANWIHIGLITICYAAIMILNYLAFVNSGKLLQFIGNGFILIIGKIMGLILSIIAVNMILEGVKLAFGV